MIVYRLTNWAALPTKLGMSIGRASMRSWWLLHKKFQQKWCSHTFGHHMSLRHSSQKKMSTWKYAFTISLPTNYTNICAYMCIYVHIYVHHENVHIYYAYIMQICSQSLDPLKPQGFLLGLRIDVWDALELSGILAATLGDRTWKLDNRWSIRCHGATILCFNMFHLVDGSFAGKRQHVSNSWVFTTSNRLWKTQDPPRHQHPKWN